MTGKIIIRPDAVDDLVSIIRYFEEHSPEVANRFEKSIRRTLHDLVLMPEKASLKRYRTAKLADIRAWRVEGFSKHLIFYRTIDVGIEVIAIMYGARNVVKILRKRS